MRGRYLYALCKRFDLRRTGVRLTTALYVHCMAKCTSADSNGDMFKHITVSIIGGGSCKLAADVGGLSTRVREGAAGAKQQGLSLKDSCRRLLPHTRYTGGELLHQGKRIRFQSSKSAALFESNDAVQLGEEQRSRCPVPRRLEHPVYRPSATHTAQAYTARVSGPL